MSLSSNIKYKQFADEYLKSLNATQSYLKVYPNSTRRTAEVESSKLLRKPEIQQYLNERLEQLEEETHVSISRIVQELAKIAFADIGDFIDLKNYTIFTDGRGKEVKEFYIKPEDLDKIDSSLISEISKTKHGFKVKLHDKQKALELLGKRFALFTDNLNVGSMDEIADRITQGRERAKLSAQKDTESTDDEVDIFG